MTFIFLENPYYDTDTSSIRKKNIKNNKYLVNSKREANINFILENIL